MPEGRFDHGKGRANVSVAAGRRAGGERRLADAIPPEEICALAAKQIAGEFGERVL